MDPDLEFRAKLPDRGAYRSLAAAAVIVVVVVGIGLLPANDETALTNLATAPSLSSPPSPPSRSPSRAAYPTPIPERLEIQAGSYYINAPSDIRGRQIRIRLTMPAGWASAEAGTAIYRADFDWRYPDTNGPSLAAHAVTGVVTDVCRTGPRVRFEKVGPTVEDLTRALATLVGPAGRGPTAVKLGGYPAKKFVLTDILDSCGGPEGRWLWENASGSHFGFLKGATATIYVVDVDGDRLVIATHDRGSPAKEVRELDAIVASIDIEPIP
jgi:hypothetical protein